ncbi:hypothetical protein [Kribbella sp. HUAS MG21]|uniref:Uncharacterized protein n=1 Tax=Kribbella sp. HUAS MG21 TaxID=3160966 RepID=A0AAU7TPN8_9ACTN
MANRGWLNRDDQFLPGQVLFSSDRQFEVWVYTVSHSQLLLRARADDEHTTTLDVLFKPVDAVRLRMSYDGLTVRCADQTERTEVLLEQQIPEPGQGVRVLKLDGGYVVCGALGWLEDDRDGRAPSDLASFAPATDPSRILGGG